AAAAAAHTGPRVHRPLVAAGVVLAGAAVLWLLVPAAEVQALGRPVSQLRTLLPWLAGLALVVALVPGRALRPVQTAAVAAAVLIAAAGTPRFWDAPSTAALAAVWIPGALLAWKLPLRKPAVLRAIIV